ncbi:MAG TPA: bifunctional precorrin-2 dehydrogenase/sirohydrochlorin ferrochelatase [Candidatus Acetothermia bacterium]|nr:bifunctional precorrin-2 dehydrogenase/sirohydrochlorin ferrochelatase [Candidatus Acetothermia bacterium]
MKSYPIFLVKLQDKCCILVGGGDVAERKVHSLLEVEARVTVISPSLTVGLQQLVEEGRVELVLREYQRGDLAEAFLVIGATDDADTNEQVWQEAVERGLLVNIVDDLARCNFIVPSLVRRGNLCLAISTGGKSPALAKRLRERLEAEFGPEYAEFVALLGDLRERVKAKYPESKERVAIWYRLVDSDIVELIRQGRDDLVRQRVKEIIEHFDWTQCK